MARALIPGARPESASADCGRATIPEGGRSAAAAFAFRIIPWAAAIAVSLLAVSGAGGAGAQTPKRGGTVRTTVRDFVLFPLNPLTNAEDGWLER